jgi:hypothetical protein
MSVSSLDNELQPHVIVTLAALGDALRSCRLRPGLDKQGTRQKLERELMSIKQSCYEVRAAFRQAACVTRW